MMLLEIWALVLVPIIAWIPLMGIFQSIQDDWRESFLSSSIVWGVCLTIITEILSILKLLNVTWVFILWLVVNISLFLIYFRFFYSRQQVKNLFSYLDPKNLNLFSLVLLILIGFIILILGLLAVFVAPNNWDSMIYHLSRVEHWRQNQSVAHYPSHTLKQLHQNPWAEFVILHLQILTDGDRFANLVQWGSMVGSLIGVSLIARRLGAKIQGQILAVVFCATIPMGILQASTTQNDYVVAFWLVCFTYFTLLIVQEGVTALNISRLGASLGLAILTKGTAYIYAFPFCLWLGIWGVTYLRWNVWKPIALISAIILFLNLGHYSRNFFLFDSPLGLGLSEQSTETDFSLPLLISNLTRNLSFHADIVRNLWLQNIITPTTGITNKLIIILHDYLNLDVSDPRITRLSGTKFSVPGLSFSEDTAGNPLHLSLIFMSLLLLIFNKKIRAKKYIFIYSLAIIGAFILFCALITWSPWRSRLHLPLFILFAAVVGTIFSQSFNSRITSCLAVFLIVISSPWIFNNRLKPIIGENNIFQQPRIEHYFANKSYLKEPYTEVVNKIKEQVCSDIGLTGNSVSYEYPFWALLHNSQDSFTFRHINVTNVSATKMDLIEWEDENKPCAIIGVNSQRNPENSTADVERLTTDHGNYNQIWQLEPVQLFIKEN